MEDKIENIIYDYVVNLTKYFVSNMDVDRKFDLNWVCKCVKNYCPMVKDMAYVFDETIWPPDAPEKMRDYVQFTVQLQNRPAYLPFRLYLYKGYDQDAIFLSNNYIWSDYGR